MKSLSSLIGKIENLENHLRQGSSAAGRILFFDDYSFSGPKEADDALQMIEGKECFSKVVRISCQNREGTIFRDMIFPHPPADIISLL